MFELDFTLLFQIINFFILLWALYKIGFQPISNMLEKRRLTIKGNLEKAEQEQQMALSLRQEYETHLQNARKEAQDIMNTANRMAEQKRDEILNMARVETDRLRAQTELQILQAKEKALLEIRQEAISLSMTMAEKILAKELDENRQAELVRDVIGKIDSSSVVN
ncbi:MAG: F0F1 ATP synthase subunit B [Negativicutes bacterium]|nr:F0F1 ATP synthase subunit B [Negativicutes bacterium]